MAQIYETKRKLFLSFFHARTLRPNTGIGKASPGLLQGGPQESHGCLLPWESSWLGILRSAWYQDHSDRQVRAYLARRRHSTGRNPRVHTGVLGKDAARAWMPYQRRHGKDLDSSLSFVSLEHDPPAATFHLQAQRGLPVAPVGHTEAEQERLLAHQLARGALSAREDMLAAGGHR